MDFEFLDANSADEDLYKILGCDETSTSDQIRCEYKLKVKKFHPDKAGQEDKEAQENYDKLRWAYETLSNEDSREKYDAWKRSGLSVPFKAWLSLRDANRTSMHWAGQPKKKLMLEDKSNEAASKEDVHVDNEKKVVADSSKSGVQENESPQQKEETSLKRPFCGWGSSGLSRKFKSYKL